MVTAITVTAITILTKKKYTLMKFYDRKHELALFADILRRSRSEAQMTVLVGRRRIGKTELALRCGGEEPLLYFFVARKSEAMLLRDFCEETERKLAVPVGECASFASLFRQLLFISQSRPFTLVIDEFQDWTRINPSVFSEMQREWDLARRGSHMNLVISGSIYSLMHRIFEDSKEPLFSRANRIVNLQPFSTGVLREIIADHNPGYTPADLLSLYTLTHGVAWYVGMFMDNAATTRQAMLDMLTEENSPFIGEGKNLLVEEFGADYANYFSILACIASGEMTRAQIENMTGIKEIGGYLERLRTHYNIIDRHTPVFAKPKTKNVRYIISDNFLTVWFRFFYKYQSFIESGALMQLRRIVNRDMSVVEGMMLERYFRQRLRESQLYTRIGGYWDRRGENEIDIVAVNEIDGTADIYEVKKQSDRYDERLLRAKVDAMLTATPELRGMQLRLGCLSMDNM